MSCRALAVGLAIAIMTTATPAQAQEPAKLKVEDPQAPDGDADAAEISFVDKARRWAEEKRIADRLSPREGPYARFGGMVTGSGLALGAGYRKYFFDERVFADVSAALSTKLYKAVDAKARWARFWGDRVELWSEFRYRDYPQEDYFGLGEHSDLPNRISYGIESTDIVGRAVVKPVRWLSVGTDLGFFNPRIVPAPTTACPRSRMCSQTSTPRRSPRCEQPNFLHNTFFAEVDYRDKRGHPTRGGFYRAAFGTWEDVTLEQFDHHRFDADATQFFPLAPKHVFAVRVGLSYVNNETGDRVPFYFLPVHRRIRHRPRLPRVPLPRRERPVLQHRVPHPRPPVRARRAVLRRRRGPRRLGRHRTWRPENVLRCRDSASAPRIASSCASTSAPAAARVRGSSSSSGPLTAPIPDRFPSESEPVPEPKKGTG